MRLTGFIISNGVGLIQSSADDTATRGFVRSGPWGHGSLVGVLTMDLSNLPGYTSVGLGFRVSR